MDCRAGDEDTGKRKWGFKRLRSRLVGRLRRKGAEHCTIKQSQSFSDVSSDVIGVSAAFHAEDDELSIATVSRAMSHDSIFKTDQSQNPTEPTRVQSQDSVEGGRVRALQLKLQQQKMHLGPPPLVPRSAGRRDDVATSDDDGSPHIQCRPLCPVSPDAAPGLDLDLDRPARFAGLDTSAARHRLSIKPRNQRGGTKKHRATQGRSRPPSETLSEEEVLTERAEVKEEVKEVKEEVKEVKKEVKEVKEESLQSDTEAQRRPLPSAGGSQEVQAGGGATGGSDRCPDLLDCSNTAQNTSKSTSQITVGSTLKSAPDTKPTRETTADLTAKNTSQTSQAQIQSTIQSTSKGTTETLIDSATKSTTKTTVESTARNTSKTTSQTTTNPATKSTTPNTLESSAQNISKSTHQNPTAESYTLNTLEATAQSTSKTATQRINSTTKCTTQSTMNPTTKNIFRGTTKPNTLCTTKPSTAAERNTSCTAHSTTKITTQSPAQDTLSTVKCSTNTTEEGDRKQGRRQREEAGKTEEKGDGRSERKEEEEEERKMGAFGVKLRPTSRSLRQRSETVQSELAVKRRSCDVTVSVSDVYAPSTRKDDGHVPKVREESGANQLSRENAPPPNEFRGQQEVKERDHPTTLNLQAGPPTWSEPCPDREPHPGAETLPSQLPPLPDTEPAAPPSSSSSSRPRLHPTPEPSSPSPSSPPSSSSPPSWMELAKRKSRAWSDKTLQAPRLCWND